MLDKNDRQKKFNDPRKFIEIILNSDNYIGFKSDDVPLDKKLETLKRFYFIKILALFV